jgi:hypothetical protein
LVCANIPITGKKQNKRIIACGFLCLAKTLLKADSFSINKLDGTKV